MTKAEFINALSGRLAQLPSEERERHVAYYSEIIFDMMEDGIDEYQAVERLGNVSDIANGILHETPLPKLIRSRVCPGGGWNVVSIILLILGFPLWFPLLMAAFAVIITIYAVIWVVIITLFAVFASIAVSAAALIIFAVINIGLHFPSALMILGGGAACAGLSILAFYGAVLAAKALVKLTVLLAAWVKSLFIRKEV